ncbi:MAG: hypothetical protein IJZ36_02985, partial [Bacilli bacterium]|nr:hypothetical protein [Bacilli bacterium]
MQEKDLIKEYHKLSARHVLVLEADMSQQEIDRVVRYADKERKAGNELVGEMRKRYEQLIRTKRYRKLLGLYGKTESKEKRRTYAKQLNEMQREYNVTWDYCRKTMIPIGKKYGIQAVTSLTKAEDIWGALEKCLYSNGRTIHFSKRNELPSIRAKQITRGIIINVKNKSLEFKFNDLVFSGKVTDRFKKDEVKAI